MKVAFTICSNNYLSQAKILGDSLIKFNAEYKFIIFLVDKKNDLIDYNFFYPYEIVPIEDIFSTNFSDLWKKYDIVELNTSVKASVFKFLFSKYNRISFLFYFDPDIMLFDRLIDLEAELNDNDILLTPHIVSPISPDEHEPSENTFLNFGIYNLGFLGVKRSQNVDSFLNWWEERSLKSGFNNPAKGFYVDQLWINLAPLLFKKTKILFSMGYNAGPWNLHERGCMKEKSDKYCLPDGSNLAFYHFSSYDYKYPNRVSKYYSRYTFENTPTIKNIYSTYQTLLLQNNVEQYSFHKCFYVEERYRFFKKKNSRKKIKDHIKFVTPPFITDFVQHLRLRHNKTN